jgi:hypothetical protein
MKISDDGRASVYYAFNLLFGITLGGEIATRTTPSDLTAMKASSLPRFIRSYLSSLERFIANYGPVSVLEHSLRRIEIPTLATTIRRFSTP